MTPVHAYEQIVLRAPGPARGRKRRLLVYKGGSPEEQLMARAGIPSSAEPEMIGSLEKLLAAVQGLAAGDMVIAWEPLATGLESKQEFRRLAEFKCWLSLYCHKRWQRGAMRALRDQFRQLFISEWIYCRNNRDWALECLAVELRALEFFRREQRIGDAMIHAYGLEIPRTLEEICDPRRIALLVYDMQVGVLRQIKNGPTITAAVQRVVDAARAAGVRVIFTRHMSLPKELMGIFQLRMAMAWQRTDTVEEVQPWFLRDSPGFQLITELSPRSTEAVLDKITMSAFEGTPLDIVLRDCGINAFAIVGVAMEVGIEPTVRHAADLGYIPVIVRDACGAGHEEAAQRSVASLEYAGDAVFTDVDTISALWSARQADRAASGPVVTAPKTAR
jgi:nicotinamidase-related amidase